MERSKGRITGKDSSGTVGVEVGFCDGLDEVVLAPKVIVCVGLQPLSL